jgi:hypothetical protein
MFLLKKILFQLVSGMSPERESAMAKAGRGCSVLNPRRSRKEFPQTDCRSRGRTTGRAAKIFSSELYVWNPLKMFTIDKL